MDETDYPTATVPLDVFGKRQVAAGDKETFEVVSIDDASVQIRCVSKKATKQPDGGKLAAQRYNGQMSGQMMA